MHICEKKMKKYSLLFYSNTSGKPIKIRDPDQCPADQNYISFHSVVFTVAIDDPASDKSLSINFLLRSCFSFSFNWTISFRDYRYASRCNTVPTTS